MYVGIDMGTNSVGLAVADENYNLYRVKGKDFWSSRLFDEAHTAEERRINRISRRRRQREVARQGILRELFSDAINQVDEGFFARLDESKYHMEDREIQQPYALFADTGYTDKKYYKDYPTIFHLRNELLHPIRDRYDVRLVYLAIANMFKHRGHFLNETLDVQKMSSNAEDVYQQFLEVAAMYSIEFPVNIDVDELVNIISEKGESRSKHLENVCQYLGVSKKEKQEYEILKLLCGMTGVLFNIYGKDAIDEENKKFSLNFRDSNYEEKEAEALELLGEEYFELIEVTKELHDISVLSTIIKGHQYLSEARVESYEEHKKDLDMLQHVIKKYDKKAYDEMFRVMKEGNYSALAEEFKGKKVTELKVCIPFIPPKSTVKINGFRYYLGGKSGNSIYLNNIEPLYLSLQDEEYLRKIMKAIDKADYEECDQEGCAIITKDKNFALFKTLILKLSGNPYRFNKWNICKILEKKEDIFRKLELERQCFVINQIICWINSATQNVNLKDIKGSEHAGTQLLNKKISECKEAILIHQSVTGMYERKIDLLKI